MPGYRNNNNNNNLGANHKWGKQRIVDGISNDTESNSISTGSVSTSIAGDILHRVSSISNDNKRNSIYNVPITASTSGDEHHRVASSSSVSDHSLVISDGYKISRRTRKHRHNHSNHRMDQK